jgi:hypothetical protein
MARAGTPRLFTCISDLGACLRSPCHRADELKALVESIVRACYAIQQPD